ncbi:uncharacterized [Tachysurus ichikawai]
MWQERFIAGQRPLQTTAQCRLGLNENVLVQEAKQARFKTEVALPEPIPEKRLTSFSLETIQSPKKVFFGNHKIVISAREKKTFHSGLPVICRP